MTPARARARRPPGRPPWRARRSRAAGQSRRRRSPPVAGSQPLRRGEPSIVSCHPPSVLGAGRAARRSAAPRGRGSGRQQAGRNHERRRALSRRTPTRVRSPSIGGEQLRAAGADRAQSPAHSPSRSETARARPHRARPRAEHRAGGTILGAAPQVEEVWCPALRPRPADPRARPRAVRGRSSHGLPQRTTPCNLARREPKRIEAGTLREVDPDRAGTGPPGARSLAAEAQSLALARERAHSEHTGTRLRSSSTVPWTDAQLARLSPRQREVLQLVERDGLSIPAVAERLGISRSTVREHLIVARNRVRGGPLWTPEGRGPR